MTVALKNTKVEVRAVLGFAKITIGELMRKNRGSIIDLSTFLGYDLRLFVKGTCIGSANIVVSQKGSTKKLSAKIVKIH